MCQTTLYCTVSTSTTNRPPNKLPILPTAHTQTRHSAACTRQSCTTRCPPAATSCPYPPPGPTSKYQYPLPRITKPHTPAATTSACLRPPCTPWCPQASPIWPHTLPSPTTACIRPPCTPRSQPPSPSCPPPTTRTNYSMHQTNMYTMVPNNIPKLPTTTARYHSTTTMPCNTKQSTKKTKNPTILTISHRTLTYPLKYI